MARISSCCSPWQARTPFRCWMRGRKNFPPSALRASAKLTRAKALRFRTRMACIRSPLMAMFISHSPAETEALGESWGRAAEPGLVIGLSGELGAGKTQLVKGLARGLGITARVHSPTFTLVHEYVGGRLSLFH